ncbi:uncharacterized protein F4812DRAFT_410201 [Daldinia caldariorum]|uniref:uncharacterized protein n=1 Tax=Daldinia caldariorum TaxID=326644 RepID=UPI0020081E13|nr:uncharacterized protein F4812DRAFT_410201 [Daldinia caldariorum]KAI1472774.1 hypothetical protein F4812DRAFT_410201 [Daldinia caldariorum]
MASGLFIDPLTLLRVVPLVTSTASIVIAGDSDLFLSALLSLKQHRGKVNEIAPRYFEVFFWKGLRYILLTYGLSATCGLVNAYSRSHAAASWNWYAAGSVLALAHFAFVPKIMWKVKDAIDAKEEPNGGAANALRGWLAVHHVRTALVDVPSWACFLVATVKALKSI